MKFESYDMTQTEVQYTYYALKKLQQAHEDDFSESYNYSLKCQIAELEQQLYTMQLNEVITALSNAVDAHNPAPIPDIVIRVGDKAIDLDANLGVYSELAMLLQGHLDTIDEEEQ